MAELVNNFRITNKALTKFLFREWKKELQEKNPNILKAVLRFVGWKYLIVILLVLIQETALVTGQAYFVGSAVHYFENRQEWNHYNVYVTIAGFFSVTAIYLFTHNTNLFMTEYYSMKLKIAFCTLVYRKAIRLSSSSLEKSNVGQMVNLLANDVGKFQNVNTIYRSEHFQGLHSNSVLEQKVLDFECNQVRAISTGTVQTKSKGIATTNDIKRISKKGDAFYVED
ncbi:multidrug resistance-associated protein 4-like [Centruroides sculpturatus]|uniref:multidrug resistance-associated protein 4-like n=1 Tax=Centruroides sculpturatus TaxID=218467 RepID=UPI000C6DABB4|nr:multidrug resistance-associated protein 4-like [Centruroides sculpturatus]